ncbi:type I toxin-antitoxin system Fst family toxin [Aerococcus loyolae]|nr:type I toxin-antitoxin system Fst family toxin [Aerococcus loyolae]MCY3029112.1 type I toxin-antitoxin system Fst family toxin [Aerococcus loyolae]
MIKEIFTFIVAPLFVGVVIELFKRYLDRMDNDD